MRTHTRLTLGTAGITAAFVLSAVAPMAPTAATAAIGSGDRVVDQTLLQPPLLDRFAPWDCDYRRTGPVCAGEFHGTSPWELTDLPCTVPVYGTRTEHRYQRLFFDHQYRNYDRQNRTRDVDAFSTTPQGPVTGAVSTNVRYSYDFGVPGDLSTVTLTTTGIIWDLGPTQGPAIFRAVGTLVESWPFNEPGDFTGHVTLQGQTTLYDDEPVETFINDEAFVNWLCEAATGEPAAFE